MFVLESFYSIRIKKLIINALNHLLEIKHGLMVK